MAHANCGCKWYINKPLLSQAKLTAEEDMHTDITIALIEWTEIKILLPQAITGGLWKRNCNKLIQKLNQLQTGEQTHWQGGNRGVSIKNQSYVWHAAKLWQSYTWNWRKSRKKNPCFSQTVNCCQWFHEQHCKTRTLVPLALPQGLWQQGHLGNGSAWSSTWVWAALDAAEAQRPRASDHALRRGKGEKRNPNSHRTGWEKTGKIFCSPSERS